MADNSYQMLVDKLKHRPVNIPEDIEPEDLTMWLLGYQACIDQITHIIDESESSIRNRKI